MRVSCGKILLIVGILVVVGGSLGIWALVRWDSSASRYGVTDRTKAALVVQNNTDCFYIIGVQITRTDGRSWDLGTDASEEKKVFPIEHGERTAEGNIIGGGQEAFPIEPGAYRLDVTYSDLRSLADIPSVGFYVVNSLPSAFSAGRGSVVRFTLAGGHSGGAMYTPPELFGP